MKVAPIKLIFLSLMFCATSYATEYVIITNSGMQKLSVEEVRAIFLKKTLYSKGRKVVPVNLASGDEVRASFEQHVLKMNLAKLKSYWTKQHYLGNRPPITQKSQNTVKAFVTKVDGAISYINKQNVDGNVKIIYKWSD